jgi:hypothetical protein
VIDEDINAGSGYPSLLYVGSPPNRLKSLPVINIKLLNIVSFGSGASKQEILYKVGRQQVLPSSIECLENYLRLVIFI